MSTTRNLVIIALLAAATTAFADDGWMPMNGSALAFGGKHPTVQMVSEVVRATVGKNSSTVTCDFVFKNHGPACTVRMGFPNGGEQDGELEAKYLDKHTLKSFRSYVDGKRIETTHVVLKDDVDLTRYNGIIQWEVKTVKFQKGQTLHVRDTYTAPHGVSNLITYRVSHFYYVLSTGGSWNGNIERADVIVTVSPSLIPRTPAFVLFKAFGSEESTADKMYAKMKSDATLVGYDGAGTANVKGRTITFTKKNWSPKEEDNIVLTFGSKPLKNH